MFLKNFYATICALAFLVPVSTCNTISAYTPNTPHNSAHDAEAAVVKEIDAMIQALDLEGWRNFHFKLSAGSGLVALFSGILAQSSKEMGGVFAVALLTSVLAGVQAGCESKALYHAEKAKQKLREHIANLYGYVR